jgi:hypothetical protein
MKDRDQDSRDLLKHIDPICPTGKSANNSVNRLSSPIRKNISVFPKPKSDYVIRRPVPQRGVGHRH